MNEPTYPQYAVYCGYAFTAYLSETDKCEVVLRSSPFDDESRISWMRQSYMPHLDNQPTLTPTADCSDYVQVLCTEADFRAAYETAKAAISAKEAQWLAPVAIQYATIEQRGEIVRLLNSPAISNAAKTKMLLAMMRMSGGKANEALAELRASIEHHENGRYQVVEEAYTVNPIAA